MEGAEGPEEADQGAKSGPVVMAKQPGPMMVSGKTQKIMMPAQFREGKPAPLEGQIRALAYIIQQGGSELSADIRVLGEAIQAQNQQLLSVTQLRGQMQGDTQPMEQRLGAIMGWCVGVENILKALGAERGPILPDLQEQMGFRQHTIQMINQLMESISTQERRQDHLLERCSTSCRAP